MKLPSNQIASKVKSSALATLAFTIILGIISKSPLADNAWFAFTEDQAIIAAITSFISILFGYAKEETAYDDSVTNRPTVPIEVFDPESGVNFDNRERQ